MILRYFKFRIDDFRFPMVVQKALATTVCSTALTLHLDTDVLQ